MREWQEPNPRESLRDKVLADKVDCGNMCFSMPLSNGDVRAVEAQLNEETR